MIDFPISGVETYWWLPVVVAFVISSLTSAGGVSGAFLLLPFQVSFLGFSGPAVSPTNLIYNIVAIPSGVWRYYREGRVVWPLAVIIIAGTLPGVFLGAVIRVKYLPDPASFKLFAAIVLLYIAIRLAFNLRQTSERKNSINAAGNDFRVSAPRLSLKVFSYDFQGESFSGSTPALFALSAVVGIVGGVYGIGGGAIIAPFLVTFFALPVHTVAGAALLGTFATSIAGVLFYYLIAPYYAHTGLAIIPDWQLGALFGIGGAAGIYLGACLQRFMPANVIKAILALCMIIVALRYIIGFFF